MATEVVFGGQFEVMLVNRLIVLPAADGHDFLLTEAQVVSQRGKAAAESVEADFGKPCLFTDGVDALAQGIGVHGDNKVAITIHGAKELAETGDEHGDGAAGLLGLVLVLVDKGIILVGDDGTGDQDGAAVHSHVAGCDGTELGAAEAGQRQQGAKLTGLAVDGFAEQGDLLVGEPRLIGDDNLGEFHLGRGNFVEI